MLSHITAPKPLRFCVCRTHRYTAYRTAHTLHNISANQQHVRQQHAQAMQRQDIDFDIDTELLARTLNQQYNSTHTHKRSDKQQHTKQTSDHIDVTVNESKEATPLFDVTIDHNKTSQPTQTIESNVHKLDIPDGVHIPDEIQKMISDCTDPHLQYCILQQYISEHNIRQNAFEARFTTTQDVSKYGRGSGLSMSQRLYQYWVPKVKHSITEYVRLVKLRSDSGKVESTETTIDNDDNNESSVTYESIPTIDPEQISHNAFTALQMDETADQRVAAADKQAKKSRKTVIHQKRVTDPIFYDMIGCIDQMTNAVIVNLLNDLLQYQLIDFLTIAQNIGQVARRTLKEHLLNINDAEQRKNRNNKNRSDGDKLIIADKLNKHKYDIFVQHGNWRVENYIRVGAILIDAVLKSADIPDWCIRNINKHDTTVRIQRTKHSLGAFQHFVKLETVNESGRGKRKGDLKRQGYMKLHDALYRYLTQVSISDMSMLNAKFKPMLIKPRPWTSYNDGGYLTIHKRVMRTKDSRAQLEALRTAELDELYQALNFLGNTPWRVNTYIYNIIVELQRLGGGVASIPVYTDEILPIKPDDTADEETQRLYKQHVERTRQTNAELNSLRADLQIRMNQAAEYIQHNSIFYCPQNIDFRGRVYPIPSHLNHQGADLARGLLLFGTGKPITADGIRWLKIHVANLYGKNKLSLVDRIAWTELNYRAIEQCVDNPLHKHSAAAQYYWEQADDPFQFLAAAHELVNCMRAPVPEEYIGHLPVHVDGSCNGLQHYAALGLDLWGGSQVNLVPHDKPQDVYQGVCDRVNEILRTTIENKSDRYELAEQLYGHITRKVVKQTVMTTVYGVTNLGARDQVYARLEERHDIMSNADNNDIDARTRVLNTYATYISQLTMDALTDLFTGARAIMDWLIACSSLISNANQTVSWITPMNLPVVQPYRQESSYQVNTVLQKVNIIDRNELSPINRRAQRGALPPNFVHSLDATHCLKTALACQRHGLTFASVHDSYWTHPATMTQLNQLLREEFVTLYSQPILYDLRQQWQSRFPFINFPPLPEVPNTNKLNLQDVLKSPYFFS